MPPDELLKHHFQYLGVEVDDKKHKDFLGKCQDLCDLYNVSEEVLVEMWVAFMVEKNAGVEPTMSSLGQMERAVLQKKNKSALDARAKIDSPTTSNQRHHAREDYVDETDILEMYGFKGPQTQQVKRSRSPEEADVAVKQESKIRALETTFSPASYTKKSETPRRLVNTESRGYVLRKFGNDVHDWKTTNRWQVPVVKADYPHVPPRALYMFDLLPNKSSKLQKVCREFGASLCSTWSKTATQDNSAITANVATQSQMEFRTWGRIFYTLGNDRVPKSVMLEGCKPQPPYINLPCVIPIDLTHLESYSIFPGQILAVEGTNPTGKILKAQTICSSGFPPPSPKPKLQENLHIFVAAGPFTASDNLDYQPLFQLIERVVENEPHVLILVGPFLPDDHQEILKATICDTYQELFEQLVEKILKFIKGKCTQVVLIPSSHDVHHDPVYPTPEFFLPKSLQSPNLHLMPDPCMLDLEGLVIGATSVDIIRHLSSNEMNRNMSGEERPSRLASHILSQACFYPLYPPSQEVNLDTKLWEKYAFIYQQPHILILPSNMRYFCKWTQDCFIVNPERLNKQTYARMIVKPSFDQPWSSQQISCEILKL